MRLSLVILTLVFFAGCARHPRYKALPITPLTLDDTISKEHRDLIDLDLRTMSWAKITDHSEAEMFGIPDFSKDNVGNWLEDRVKAIVGTTYDSRNRRKAKHVYNPEVFYRRDAFIVMLNLGAWAYINGKENKEMSTMSIGGKDFLVDSARVGILQMGEGMFSKKTVGAVGALDNLSSSFRRLSTLYHEARHSDGNGDTLAFQHVYCKSGDYIGQPACDNYSNGPYAIGRVLLEKLVPLCDECSYDEKEGLSILVADLHTRIEMRKVGDARPERSKP